jgi:hypothetical protein
MNAPAANDNAAKAKDLYPIVELTESEIWAPLPPPNYLAEGILTAGNLALVCATGSSLKTWMVTDLAVSAATGRPWLGRFPIKRQGEARLIDWESGDYEMRRRLQAVGKGKGFSGAVPGVRLVSMPEFFLNSKHFIDTIEAYAADKALIVIDSLAAGTVDLDENDSRFARPLQALKAVAARTGCCIVVLHHSRKGQGSGDEREQVRGTGAIFATCDVVLQLFRQDADLNVFSVHQTKARCGKRADPFAIRVDDVPGGGAMVCGFDLGEYIKLQKGSTKAKGDSMKARIREALHDREAVIDSANKLVETVKGRAADVKRALKSMIEDEEIIVDRKTGQLVLLL